MITFFLGWCAFSLVGTLFALNLIRTGKRRQPDTDDAQPIPLHVRAATPPYKR